MPFELEVEVKVAKPFQEEDLEELDTKRIIGKPIDPLNLEDETKFEYRRIVIDLDHLMGRGDFDGKHTIVYLEYGTFLVRMEYDVFNKVYETITKRALTKQSDFKIETSRRK